MPETPENATIEHPPALPEGALRDKVALVTGAANGLGREVARQLAAAGATVVAADIEEQPGRELADEIGGHFLEIDVSDLESNKAAVQYAVDELGGLDLVHLNAGISSPFGLGDDFDAEAYRRAMSINLDGVVYGFHAALPALRARGGGSVIATASIAGLLPIPMQPVYGSNKHAVVGLVRALAMAHAHEGIRVGALCPGFADTRIINDVREMLGTANVPLLTAEEVAEATLRLFADEDGAGKLMVVQAGIDPFYYKFKGIPGPKTSA
ncbi:MAG TPA: SDR family oxidoreductase [Solirubrobacterales bacterium]|jgi:NAD(P)-dependent dehydrogenase (short-subunit alcohol dehydrogenase family)|nr:SDR family oxidoreductase [Solirubrobacterales bacterium]